MPSKALNDLLTERQGLMRQREALKKRMAELAVRIDEMIDAERGEQLLHQLSDRDRALLTQTIQAKGIASEEAVNGQRTVR